MIQSCIFSVKNIIHDLDKNRLGCLLIYFRSRRLIQSLFSWLRLFQAKVKGMLNHKKVKNDRSQNVDSKANLQQNIRIMWVYAKFVHAFYFIRCRLHGILKRRLRGHCWMEQQHNIFFKISIVRRKKAGWSLR